MIIFSVDELSEKVGKVQQTKKRSDPYPRSVCEIISFLDRFSIELRKTLAVAGFVFLLTPK